MDRATATWTFATLVVLLLAAAWALGRAGAAAGPPAGTWIDGVPWAPSCRDRRIADQVLAIWRTHPQYAGHTTVDLVALRDPQQVASRVHELPEGRASTRWCVAGGDFGDAGTGPVVWDLFASRTILGIAYGVRPCFGRFDPRPEACEGMARTWPPEVREAAGLAP